MDQETVLSILPNSPRTAKTLREIAEDLGLDVEDGKWFEVERSLSNTLRKLVKWGLVGYDYRQKATGHKYWYATYWRKDEELSGGILGEEKVAS